MTRGFSYGNLIKSLLLKRTRQINKPKQIGKVNRSILDLLGGQISRELEGGTKIRDRSSVELSVARGTI